jgi:WD40 repeat protein
MIRDIHRVSPIAVMMILAAGALGACSQETPTPAPSVRNIPTLDVPAWTEAAAPIMLENVSEIQLLGRLDQADTPTTVFHAALAPDSLNLAALNASEVLAWDLLTGTLIFHTGRGDGTQLYYASDKTRLFLVNADGTVRLLDALTGAEETNLVGHPEYSGVTAFDPDRDVLAIGGTDGTIKVWDVFARQSLYTLRMGDAEISALAWSPDGELLGGADTAGSIVVWRGNEQTAATTLDPATDGAAIYGVRLAFDPARERITIGTTQDMRLWIPTSDAPPYRMVLGRGGATPFLTYSPNGDYLIGGNRSEGLALWSGEDGRLISVLPNVDGDRVAAAFSPDGSLLVTAVLDGEVSLWSISNLTTQGIGRSELPVGSSRIFGVEWTDDGRLILLFDANGAVYAWGIGEN